VSNERRLAVVTGTSSGIGLAIATRLLQDGWHVQGWDIAAPRLAQSGFESRTLDLGDGAATQAAAQAAGAVQAFVHAAGLLRVGAAGAMQPADGELMWRVHVDALCRIANVLLPRMCEAGVGRVVLVGSRVSRGAAGRGQYAATKAALVALARSWAAEAVASGVTVNVVAPGATQTGMSQDAARQSVPQRVPPLGRLIQPDEVAALAAYLLSDAAAAITGQEIQICGGGSL
jgi:3-oxoacyl-[acyl-carrier protein] reductase